MTAEKREIFAIDVGDARVGVARYEWNLTRALPVTTLLRAKGAAEKELIAMIQEKRISLLVVGLPLSEDNSENEQSVKVRGFVRRIARRCAIDIEYEDEYGSTEEAVELLGVQGVEQREVRESGRLDATSAAIILQRYIERKGIR